MALKFIGQNTLPNYIALSSDIVDNKITGANWAGRKIYLTDTHEWKIITPDKTLDDYSQENGDNGEPALINTNVSPTTANVTAAVNTRYFADLSGLTANRNFVFPACVAGDEIVIKIKTGHATNALVLIGDTGVTLEGGSAATEWSRLFIAGEMTHWVADATNSWRLITDGRIPCIGLMTLSTDDTTNTAATNTLPTWDNTLINVGGICDLTNKRFNIRRAGFYTVSGVYNPNAAVTSGNYIIASVFLNGTGGTLVNTTYIMAAATQNLLSAVLSPRSHLCATGDNLAMYYRPQGTNIGANLEETWFQVKEG
jgi:hypothetical protein